MKSVYLISGLGADRRVFDYVCFDYCQVSHIEWVQPSGRESISTYAARLLGQIKTLRPILIGVSFGGMIAVEIAKQIETEKVVLISSVKTKFDLPRHFRAAGRLGFHRFLPVTLFKIVTPVTYWFFGTVSGEERKLLKSIISETDDRFLEWAVSCILNWRNEHVLPNLVHVHGTKDRIFPFRTAHFTVTDGGHLMIVNKAEELDGIIKRTIS